MKKSIAYALRGIVLVSVLQAAASAQELPAMHYTTEKEVNPLPSPAVTGLLQDRLGYIWLSMYGKGLARYDGAYDVVLSDINMPEMDGLTLLTKMEELNNPALKVVIVSAYGDMENIRIAMNRGAFDFITKPIDFLDLEVTINKTLKHLNLIKQAQHDRNKMMSLQRDLDLAARIQQSILSAHVSRSQGDFIICRNDSCQRSRR